MIVNMKRTNLDKRFFGSTRGRLVLLLRAGNRTVNELAAELGLTDNAVRAHLLGLERDGLVAPAGSIKGFRKPHATYRLTDEARHIFPKSYDSILNRLIGVLKGRLKRSPLNAIFRDVGSELAGDDLSGLTPEQRMTRALDSLEEMGGAPRLLNEDGKVFIKSESCPFADSVSEHPEVCKIAESMLEKIVGKKVIETCDRTGTPKCCFAIQSSPRPA
jgi:predicted ArsR family transcriptional regulator